jgi:hypothetical protein
MVLGTQIGGLVAWHLVVIAILGFPRSHDQEQQAMAASLTAPVASLGY